MTNNGKSPSPVTQPKIIQKHLSAFGGKVAPGASNLKWRAWPALPLTIHKLCVKHAIHLEDSAVPTDSSNSGISSKNKFPPPEKIYPKTPCEPHFQH
ncbi:MAG: hypothetical protein KAJ52_05690 [Sedimentisphaerales bacterium]|nr:hypothetical protein [Sedimentisphaerales bacterium]